MVRARAWAAVNEPFPASAATRSGVADKMAEIKECVRYRLKSLAWLSSSRIGEVGLIARVTSTCPSLPSPRLAIKFLKTPASKTASCLAKNSGSNDSMVNSGLAILSIVFSSCVTLSLRIETSSINRRNADEDKFGLLSRVVSSFSCAD